jgi:hypothetical protein
MAGRGVDLGGDLGFGKRIGDRIGLAKLAFDLDEKWNHCSHSEGMSGG